LIHEWINFIRQPETRPHIVFLSDYDMLLTEHLVQGVDVWINTPRRPWEASGTSGMKVLVNGGINLSELDGWWAEATRRKWGGRSGTAGAWRRSRLDAVEADHTLRPARAGGDPGVLYARRKRNSHRMVKRMRESMARLTPRFSANRTVREYTEQHYLPAAAAYHLRTANNGAIGRQMLDWQHSLDQKWAALHFGEVKVETRNEQHVFEVQVYLADLEPNAVRVELYADRIEGGALVRQEMKRVRQLAGASGGYIYSGAVSSARPPADYTARVIPHYDGVAIPLEDARILWQR